MAEPTSIHTITKAIDFRSYSATNLEAISIVTVIDGVLATKATLTVLESDIRYRFDGLDDPTTTSGHFLSFGLEKVIHGHTNLDQLRIIAVGGTAVISVTLEAPEE